MNLRRADRRIPTLTQVTVAAKTISGRASSRHVISKGYLREKKEVAARGKDAVGGVNEERSDIFARVLFDEREAEAEAESRSRVMLLALRRDFLGNGIAVISELLSKGPVTHVTCHTCQK